MSEITQYIFMGVFIGLVYLQVSDSLATGVNDRAASMWFAMAVLSFTPSYTGRRGACLPASPAWQPSCGGDRAGGLLQGQARAGVHVRCLRQPACAGSTPPSSSAAEPAACPPACGAFLPPCPLCCAAAVLWDKDRLLLRRESQQGMYSVTAWFAARTGTVTPMQIFQTSLFCVLMVS